MSLVIEILVEGKPYAQEDILVPGSHLNITVSSEEDLKFLSLLVSDQEDYPRYLKKLKGNFLEFQTNFPETVAYGQWHLRIVGHSLNGENIEHDIPLYIHSTSEVKTKPLQVDKDPIEITNIESETEIELNEIQQLDIDEMEEEIKPLTIVKGVGKVTETKLLEAGIITIQQLADATVTEIISAGIRINQAATIIENAKIYLMEE